jgi:hypothetical protein
MKAELIRGRDENHHRVIHVPIGTTPRMKMAAVVGTNAEKSPNSPLLQRGRAVGPGDFCADRNFYRGVE